MKSIFLDCNDQLAPVWASVIRPTIRRSTSTARPFARDELPRVIGGYEIALDDHSYMPTIWSRSARNSSTSFFSAPVRELHECR